MRQEVTHAFQKPMGTRLCIEGQDQGKVLGRRSQTLSFDAKHHGTLIAMDVLDCELQSQNTKGQPH